MAKAHKPDDEWDRRQFDLDNPNASDIHPHFRIISEGQEPRADGRDTFPILFETLRAATLRALCLCFEKEPGADRVKILRAEIYKTIVAAIPDLGIKESEEIELFDVFVSGATQCKMRQIDTLNAAGIISSEPITPDMFDIPVEQRAKLWRLMRYHGVDKENTKRANP